MFPNSMRPIPPWLAVFMGDDHGGVLSVLP